MSATRVRTLVIILSLVGLLTAGLFAGCAGGSSDSPSPPSGVLATFVVGDEQFKVWVTNEATVRQLRELEAGTSQATIPNGRIRAGQGEGEHNSEWSWHLDPEEIEMAELTMEICDAQPSYVEANLDEFTGNVGRYCPWAAELADLQDL